MELQVDQVIAAYLKLRDKKDSMEAAVKEQVKEVKAKMEKLEAWLREQADAQGVTSFKTKAGTAFITTTDFANVADWDAVLEFIKNNDAYDMLEKRVSKNAVRGYIEQRKEVPAGINYGTRLDVNVRRPTARGEE
jgi:hypothetical protein